MWSLPLPFPSHELARFLRRDPSHLLGCVPYLGFVCTLDMRPLLLAVKCLFSVVGAIFLAFRFGIALNPQWAYLRFSHLVLQLVLIQEPGLETQTAEGRTIYLVFGRRNSSRSASWASGTLRHNRHWARVLITSSSATTCGVFLGLVRWLSTLRAWVWFPKAAPFPKRDSIPQSVLVVPFTSNLIVS